MNDSEKKIHILCQELIPILEDLEPDAQQIVINHMKECSTCQNLQSKRIDVDESFSEFPQEENGEIKPLRKLVHINIGVKALLIMVRILILSFITYNSLRFHDLSSFDLMAINTIQAGGLLFYLPSSIFLIVFTWTFLDRKWVIYSLIADLVILVLFWNLDLILV